MSKDDRDHSMHCCDHGGSVVVAGKLQILAMLKLRWLTLRFADPGWVCKLADYNVHLLSQTHLGTRLSTCRGLC